MEKAATVDNLVLLTFEEAEAHEDSDLQSIQYSEPSFFEKIEAARRRIYCELGSGWNSIAW